MAEPGESVMAAAEAGASAMDILVMLGVLLVAFAVYRMRTQSSEIPVPRHERNYFVDSNSGKYRLIAVVSLLLVALGFYFDSRVGDSPTSGVEMPSMTTTPVAAGLKSPRQEAANSGGVATVDPAQDLLARAREKLTKADSEQALGNPRKAREAYVEARILYSQQGNVRGEAAALFKLGGLEQRQGQLPQARDALRLALELYRKVQDKKGEAHILKNLAEVDRGLGNEEDARSEFVQAMGLYRELGDELGVAHALSGLGDIDRSLGNVTDAQASYKDALSLFQQNNDRLGIAYVQRGMGEIQLQRGRALDARKSFNAALEIYRGENNTLGEAHALRGRGDAERMLGNFHESRKAYSDARSYYERLADSTGEASTLTGIGALEHTFGHSLDAREAFQKALAIYQRDNIRIGEANVHSQIGDVEKALGNLTEAREAYLRARLIYQEEGVPGGQSAVDKSLAELEKSDEQPAGDDLPSAASLSSAGSESLNEGSSLAAVGDFSGMSEEGDAAEDSGSSSRPQRILPLHAVPARTQAVKVVRSEPPPTPIRRAGAAQGATAGETSRLKRQGQSGAGRRTATKPVRASGKPESTPRKLAPQRKIPKKPVPGLPANATQQSSRNRRSEWVAPPTAARPRPQKLARPAARATPSGSVITAPVSSRPGKELPRTSVRSAKPRATPVASARPEGGKVAVARPSPSAAGAPMSKVRVATRDGIKSPSAKGQSSSLNPLIAQDLKELTRAKKLFNEAQKIYENLTKKHAATLIKAPAKSGQRSPEK